MKNSPKVYLIGNAHLDPVWLWRFPDGLSEIKATFRSALDRIAEFPGFIFTSAAISYYRWVEENCPDMFREIQKAVADGRWCITGAMWVQPDCNIPSPESFARHFLYSQKYIREKFGITIKTGYNVDSFGHNSALPKLLLEGGMENYVYMRPSEGNEKHYLFPDQTFRWQCGDDEVVAFRIFDAYCKNFRTEQDIEVFDKFADTSALDFMVFYGVGNHGGGPTITNLKLIEAYQQKSAHEFVLAGADKFFDDIRQTSFDKLPVYEGDLQNHASGCYSANSYVKMANAAAEDRLTEAEKWQTMANALLGLPNPAESTEDAWKGVLFNQFHDILCGCSIEAAYDDAKAFFESAKAAALRIEYQALQSISWAVDTDKGVKSLSKEADWHFWETNDLGTPIVLFNPLSYDVKVPVYLRKSGNCAGITCVTKDGEWAVPFQKVRSDVTNGDDKYYYLVNAGLPAFGYRTFWMYGNREWKADSDGQLKATEYSLENALIKVEFDSATGFIKSLVDKRTGEESVGAYAARPVLLDDSPYDTWSHGAFVFDKLDGEFTSPRFELLENGVCEIKLSIKHTCRGNSIEQIYTLYPDDPAVHVSAHVFMQEKLKMLKLTFAPDFEIENVTYGSAGDRITKEADGREQPMQRFVAVTNGKSGLAVSAKGKYSASANREYFAFVGVRTCYFADHYGRRDDRMHAQDLGENKFEYTIAPFSGDYVEIEKINDKLHAEFPHINETYHRGTLPQSGSLIKLDADNISVTAVKAAEDGNGLIFRLRETAGRETEAKLTWLGKEYAARVKAKGFVSYRLSSEGAFTRTNLLEDYL